jgi:hypothetical protein
VLQVKISQDRDNVRSYQGTKYALPVQLAYLMDIFGCQWHPDNLIKEGLKQPDCIKVPFEKETKEITGHIVTDQA